MSSVNKKLALLIFILLIIGFFAGVTYGCFFRNTFGIICPSCGITRAWQAIFHGNIKSAFVQHPMFWFPPAALFYCCLNKPLISKRADLWIMGIFMVLYSVIYVLRFLLG